MGCLEMEMEDLDAIEKEKHKRDRVVRLQRELNKRLDKYAPMGREPFQQMIRKEAEELVKESFGYNLLDAIGYVYVQKAKQFIGSQKGIGIVGWWHSASE